MERLPKKTSRPRPKKHPLRAGPGFCKRVVFLCLRKTKYTQDRQASKFPNRMSVQKCERGLWIRIITHFCLLVCELHRQPNKIIFIGFFFQSYTLFRTFEKPSFFGQSSRTQQKSTLRHYDQFSLKFDCFIF